MELEEVDILSAQSFEAALDRANQVIPRRAYVVRPFPGAKRRLCRNENFVPSARHCSPQDLLRFSRGINIRAIEHIHSRFQADIHKPGGLFHVSVAPRRKQWPGSPECPRPKS